MADALAPRASVEHAIDGRLRLSLPELRDRTAAMTALAEAASRLPGVRRALGRPRTASLILEFEGPAAPLCEALAEAGLVRIRPRDPAMPLHLQAELAVAYLDGRIRERSEELLDLRSAAGVVLLLLAAAQAARGQLLAPVTTLLANGLLLLRSPEGE